MLVIRIISALMIKENNTLRKIRCFIELFCLLHSKTPHHVLLFYFAITILFTISMSNKFMYVISIFGKGRFCFAENKEWNSRLPTERKNALQKKKNCKVLLHTWYFLTFSHSFFISFFELFDSFQRIVSKE